MGYELRRSGLQNLMSGSAGVADEIGEADTAVSVAEQRKAGKRGDAAIQSCHAGEVPDGVLRQTVGPAANEVDVGLWQRAKDAGQLGLRESGEIVVRCVEEGLSGLGAEEGSEQATAGGNATVELLIDKGAGQKMSIRRGWNQKTESWRELDAGRVEVAHCDDDGGAGLHVEELRGLGIKWTQELATDVWRRGEEDRVEDLVFATFGRVDSPLPRRSRDRRDLRIQMEPAGGNCRDETIDQYAQTAAQGRKDGGRARRGLRLKSCDEGAVFALHRDEPRHDGLHAEMFDVPAQDTAQQRRGDAGQDLFAEVPPREAGDAFVLEGGGGLEFLGAGEFGAVRLFGGCAEEAGAIERLKVGGDHHAHAVGHGIEAAIEEDVSLAGGVVGREEVVAQAELFDEMASPWFLGDPGVGAALDGEAMVVNCFDDAAEPIRAFK